MGKIRTWFVLFNPPSPVNQHIECIYLVPIVVVCSSYIYTFVGSENYSHLLVSHAVPKLSACHSLRLRKSE